VSETRLSILAVGESMIELSDAGDRLAAWTFAGDALNWAVAVSHALPEYDVQHLCAVGDDSRSVEFSTFCAALGVDASSSPTFSDRNMGMYWISTVNGDRRFRYWREESAAREHLRSEHDVLPALRPDVVMFSNITLAVAGDRASGLLDEMALAKSKGATVVYDTNYRPQLWPDPERARSLEATAFELADYVHASLDDVHAVWGGSLTDFVSQLEQAGVGEAVITDGPGDVVVAEMGSTKTFRPAVVDALDTSGAGDAFFGTYVGRRLAGAGIEDAVGSAEDICAQVVQRAGALTYRTAGVSRSPNTPV
jgi:2-dehydro-3-deoxygluconokinase